jgi:hypothetical protein
VASVWVASGNPIVRETVTLMALPSNGGVRQIDFKLTLEALSQPVTLGGSREKGKAYGGFSLRFPPRRQTSIHTSDGVAESDQDLRPYKWAALQADYPSGRATVRIEPYSTNPGAPGVWCLRAYGFLNPSFPGPEPFTLTPGQPLPLRYFITITDTPGRSK